MKKIAFFVQHMISGGVENALISLTDILVEAGNNVYIFLIKKEGEFLGKISEKVHVVEIPMASKIRNSIPVGGDLINIRRCIAEKHFFQAAKFAVQHEINKGEFAELRVDFSNIPKLENRFDIAVNFHIHSPFLVKYLSEKVYAKTKFTWIHNDFSSTNYEIQRLEKYLNCCDHFFGVSEKLVSEFIQIFPQYKLVTEVALNIVPQEDIRKKAKEFYPEEYVKEKDLIKILTVGRLEEQKGYDIAIQVCKKLRNEGIKFIWFVIGEGSQRKKLERLIRENHVEKNFYLIGSKVNPYPYFLNCDLYVQTSRHEGYVTTVTEAKILCKPIVTTDVAGAREQIISGENGEIVSFSAEDIYHKVAYLIHNEAIRKKYSKSLHTFQYENPAWIKYFNDGE